MAEKDAPQVQQARLRRLLEQLMPGYTMQFTDEASTFLKFRIDDEKGTTVGVLPGEYHSSVIADKSDRQVEEIILRAINKQKEMLRE